VQALPPCLAIPGQTVGAVLVAVEHGLLHVIETVWDPGTPERRRVGIKSARARCEALVLDKRDGDFFEGLPSCLRCIVLESRR